ncbi:hypothetical protein BC833DRAFT_575495 [Globomyces pollinis-pini]|nr:hypothetical protein BC833DRAFT_575495 [Globomyces pollinis-pini]
MNKGIRAFYNDEEARNRSVRGNNSLKNSLWFTKCLSLTSHVLFSTWSAVETTVASLTIILTITRIPATYNKLIALKRADDEIRLRASIWSSQNNSCNCSFLMLPNEIKLFILAKLEVKQLCRLAQTCKDMNYLCMDNIIWVRHIARDWPDYSAKTSKSRLEKASQASLRYYNNYRPRLVDSSIDNILKTEHPSSRYISAGFRFYKQRYLTYRRFAGPIATKTLRTPFETILWEEMNHSINTIFFVSFIPFKIFGVISWPLHWICKKWHQSGNTSEHNSCLRVLVNDLNSLAEGSFNIAKCQYFGAFNLLACIAWVMEEIGTILALVNCMLMQLISICQPIQVHNRHNSIKELAARYALYSINFTLVAIMILYHIQIIIFPWTMLHYFPNYFPNYLLIVTKSITFGHWIGQNSRLSYFLVQLLWSPIICAVEEISFEYVKSQQLSESSVIMWAHQFLRLFTMCLQFFLGLLMYICLLILAITRCSNRR